MKWIKLTSLGLGLALLGPVAKGAQNGNIVEVSPLRGVLGYPIVRGEFPIWKNVSFGLSYDEAHWVGARSDFVNSKKSYRGGVLVYPDEFGLKSFFFGAGLGYETAQIGYSNEANTQTWVPSLAQDKYDKWKRDDQYLTFTQTIGMRFFAAQYSTASIRLELDQPVFEDSKLTKEVTRSDSIDYSQTKRPELGKQIYIHMGILLP